MLVNDLHYFRIAYSVSMMVAKQVVNFLIMKVVNTNVFVSIFGKHIKLNRHLKQINKIYHCPADSPGGDFVSSEFAWVFFIY